jgi:hypothetical protein
LGEQRQKKLVRLLALAAGGFNETAQDTVIFQAFGGAGALDDFSEESGQTIEGVVFPFSLVGAGGRFDTPSFRPCACPPCLNTFCEMPGLWRSSLPDRNRLELPNSIAV